MIIVRLRSFIRDILIKSRLEFLRRAYGMNISKTAVLSWNAFLDKTNPKGIHIGSYSYVANSAMILTHDYIKQKHVNTYIGENCFIGARAIIMPGVRIGNSCVIGAGTVVTKDIKDGCLCVGNPGAIVRENIKTEQYGRYNSD